MTLARPAKSAHRPIAALCVGLDRKRNPLLNAAEAAYEIGQWQLAGKPRERAGIRQRRGHCSKAYARDGATLAIR
jgi:hypothetical protein